MDRTPRSVTLTVLPAEAGLRLDALLAARLPELSRSRIKALVVEGRLAADGVVIDEPAHRVKPGGRLRLDLPEPAPARPAAEAIPLEVVYEDAQLLVLVKPPGLVVHPAPGHAGGTLVNALLAHCGDSLSGIGGVRRPGIVHRLDKDVSGLLVAAKTDRAHIGLAGQFAVHSVERAYDAVVFGVPARAEGVIEQPIARHPKDRLRMAVVPTGKRALTRWRLIEAAGTAASWLRLELATGRTHQIRVHLGTLGLGIVGDPVYRPARPPRLDPALRAWIAGLGRIALHARILAFDHPVSGERLRFERPPPDLFRELLDRIGSGTDPLRLR
jgi:23S rRNA pseudouridine1911/1915/1917 synthase